MANQKISKPMAFQVAIVANDQLALLRVPCLLVIGLICFTPLQVLGQGGFLPQPRAVEYHGTITAINPQAEVVSIQTDQGVIFANLSATRRTSDGMLIGGLPPVQTRVIGYDIYSAIERRMFIQFRARVKNRREVIGEVDMVAIIDSLPEEGFRFAGPAEPIGDDGAADPDRVDGPEREMDREAADEIGGRLIDRMRGDDGPVIIDDLDGEGGLAEIPVDGVGDGGRIGGDPIAARGDGDARGGDADGSDEDEDGVIEDLWVFGMVGSIRRNRLSINVPHEGGRRQLNVELSDDAIVRAETRDFSQASIGDVVHLLGEAIELPRVFATQITAVHLTDQLVDTVPERVHDLLTENNFDLDEDGLLVGEPIGAGDDRLGMDGNRAGGDRDGNDERVDPFTIEGRRGDAGDVEEANAVPEANARADGKIFSGRILRIN